MLDHRPIDVLVVDDEFLIRWAVSRTLTGAGNRVQEAPDAATALSLLRARMPDVALVDYRLPDTRGLNFVKTLRLLVPTMAIVMMTADRPSDVADAARLGVYAVLHKPFDMAVVEPMLRAACRAHHAPVPQTLGVRAH